MKSESGDVSGYCANRDVRDELFSGDCVLAVNVREVDVGTNDSDLKLCKSNKEIHDMQMEDIDLQPYMKYHCYCLLPEDQKVAQMIVLESQRYEVIDGVLHHENPNYPGR